jgi:hypothetical protein
MKIKNKEKLNVNPTHMVKLKLRFKIRPVRCKAIMLPAYV